jgi:hypothetical protein
MPASPSPRFRQGLHSCQLATESLPMAKIGLARSLLHLQRQLVLELLELEDLAQKNKGPGVLR